MTPSWVRSILSSPPLLVLARLMLTSAYWVGGFTKLTDWNGALAEAAHFGLYPAALFAALTIMVELIASLSVILGRWTWLGAGALGVFTLLATLIAHRFWEMTGEGRFLAANAFFEHLGLVAAFFFAAALDERRTPPSGFRT